MTTLRTHMPTDIDAPARQAAATDGRKSANLRTALVLLSIALVFFFGIIPSKYMGDPTTTTGVIVVHAIGGPVVGVAVMGAAVLLFLAFAIGRSLHK